MAGKVAIWTQAATAILAALNATGSPAAAWRARFEMVGASETAFNLFPTKIDCKYADAAHDSVNIDATFTVRAYVAATNNVDLAADPLVVWAWTQICHDPTLGGLVSDTYIDNIEIGYVDKSNSDQVCVDVTVRVEVAVGRNDPTVNKTYLAS
jgi:hypothetical protein